MSRVETIAEGVTLYLGDCREILPTLGSIGALISDPPYGVAARAGMGGGSKGDGGMWAGTTIAGDQDTTVRDEAIALAAAPFAVLSAVRIPHPPGTKATVVWNKGEHTGAGDLRMPWKPSFELVHIGGDGWSAPKRIGGIVSINAVAGCVGNRNDGHRYHPFEKPIELMAHFVGRAPAGLIVDPFLGGGSTAIAAIKLGRPFVGIELKPEFFEIAKDRIEQSLKQLEMFA
jgi:DNA modification methylase